MRTILQKGCATCVFLVLLLGSGARSHAQDLTKLATDLATKIHAKNHDSVTVVDLLDLDKKPNKLTKLLTYKLQAALAEPGRDLQVVDQSHLAELFDQMEKLSEGLIDPATARELGKVSGTDVLIHGTVMVSSMSVRVDVSAIDLQTAKVIAAGTASPTRIGLVDRLAKEIEKEEEGAASEDEPEATVTAKAAPSKKSPTRMRRDQGFLFEFGECALSGDALTCALNVTSEGRDRWLAIGMESRAWNESGEEFGPHDLAISNTQAEGRCIAKRVLKDLPTSLTLTFPNFGSDDSIVERLRVYWAEQDDCCCYQSRPVDFEKIALSDAGPSTQKKASSGGTSLGNAVGSKKGKGGILGRLTDKILDTAATTVEKIIDDKAKKLTGEDDEDPPQE
jgi:hypothetical protein